MDMDADLWERKTTTIFFKDTHDFRHLHPHQLHILDWMGEEGNLFKLLYSSLKFLILDSISYTSVELYIDFNFAIWFYLGLVDI